MFNNTDLGILSLLPLLVTLLVAFKYKSAAFSLFVGCLSGVLLLGLDPAGGFNKLAQKALGNSNFIWLIVVILFIGILFSLFKATGALDLLTSRMAARFRTRKEVKFGAWLTGIFVVDDYFGPLMSGVIFRPLTDKLKISREKLAFILDSTTASVCILVPFLGWGAYISGLILAQGGPSHNSSESLMLFIKAIPYNFYPLLLVIFTLLTAIEVIPDFGPMKKAEIRAFTTGKVIRDGGKPMSNYNGSGNEKRFAYQSNSLFFNLAVPVLIIIGIIVYSIVRFKEVMIAEAFITAVLYLSVLIFIQKRDTKINDLMDIVSDGIQGVMPTVLIISLAYCLNILTKGLGADSYILAVSKDWLTPSLLVVLSFILSAFISFSTGTSWGTYALMFPFLLPVAYSLTGGEAAPLVFKTIGAIAGGGIFGNHASPVSDICILSSTGASCDHMDHVTTQLPYAITIASISCVLYLFI